MLLRVCFFSGLTIGNAQIPIFESKECVRAKTIEEQYD